MKKRVISLFLCLALLLGAIPVGASATDDGAAQPGVETSVTGVNSVGTLLAQSLEELEDSPDAANSIQDLTVENGVATVRFDTAQDASLVVAVYEEESGRMAASGTVTVHTGEASAAVTLDGSMPRYFTAEAFLLSAEDYTPLCESFSTPLYTRAFQELLAMSADDFDADRVLNLDDSKDTNFAVYGEDVIRTESGASGNTVVSADDEALRYVIDNPDSTVKNLKNGDFWACETDTDVLIVKVASVSLQGTQAIITGQETSMEEVFDYAKIEGSATAEDATIDQSQMADGVTYNGIAAQEETKPTRGWNGEGSVEHGWFFSLHKEFEGDKLNAKLDVGLNLAVTTELRYYLARSDSYVSFSQEYKLSVKGEAEGALKLCEIPLTAVPIVIPVCGLINIEVEPNFVVEFSVSVSLEASVSWTSGLTYTQGAGFSDTSRKPTSEASLAVEGKLFIGMSVKLKFCIISSYICSFNIGAEAGAEIKGALTGREREDGKLHACEWCVDGGIYGLIKIKAEAELFKWVKLSETLAEFKVLLRDFYYSMTYNESGWGECPHWYVEGTQPEPEDPKPEQPNPEDPNPENPNPEEPKPDPGEEEPEASGSCGDNLTWTFEDGVLTIDGTGKMQGYNPDTDRPAPWQEFEIYSIIIREGVTSIGKCAFYGCSSLTSVEIPVSVTSIGNWAFRGCSSMTSVEIPVSVTSIGDCAFQSCSSLTSAEIQASVTSTGYSVFSGCSSLTSVELPSSITSIEDRAFENCSSLTSVELPARVTSIGENAFSGCSSLTSIELPARVTSIGNWAFEYCSSLTSIEIPVSVTSIGWDAFSHCSSLTSVEILASVTSIGDGAFGGCSNLTSIEIPASVTSIGDSAFENCSGLTSIEIPASVTSIGDSAFENCSSLTSIEIPASVTSIGDSAFEYCSSLTSVEIPKSVTSIGLAAFADCSSLNEVRFYGDAPCFETIGGAEASWADNVKATVYYPAENDTWTEDVRQNYGGTLTWVEWTPGKAEVPLRGVHTGGQDGDGLRFTGLTAGAPYVLLVARDRGRGLLDSGNLLYIAQGTAEADGTLRFPVRWTETGAFAGLFGQGGGALAALACDGTGCPGSGFADMPRPGNWAHAGIDFALSNGLFNGTSATTFAPSGDMTRAMLVTVLWRLDGTPAPAGENGFSDVPAGKWYTKAVTWAAENGVVNGVGGGRFDPEGRVTREQIAAILFRYAQKKGCDTAARAELTAFPDGGDVSRYAREALSWANAAGLVNGTNTPQGVRLDPKGNATRAQVATILMRYVRNVVRG